MTPPTQALVARVHDGRKCHECAGVGGIHDIKCSMHASAVVEGGRVYDAEDAEGERIEAAIPPASLEAQALYELNHPRKSDMVSMTRAAFDELTSEVVALRALVEAREGDAARLDWLERDHNAQVYPTRNEDGDFGVRVQAHGRRGFSIDGKLRAAIDAARTGGSDVR